MRASPTLGSVVVGFVLAAGTAIVAAEGQESDRAAARREPASAASPQTSVSRASAAMPRAIARVPSEAPQPSRVQARLSGDMGSGQSDSSGRSRVPPASGGGGGGGGGGHRSGGGSSAGAASGGSSGGGTAATGGSGSRSGGSSGSSGSYGTAQPRQRYPNRGADGSVAVGHAVPRGGSYPTHPVYRPPYHPWYGSWYPWGFGSWGLGFYFWDPYWYGSPYQYGYGYAGGGGGYEECSVRLLVKPRDAQVYVDGFYVGVVDEFDGAFQKLKLDEGPHRIEIRKEGFETLIFDVRTTYDHTIKLRGELRPTDEP